MLPLVLHCIKLLAFSFLPNDANGNILNLTRKDYKGDALDNLTYNYENKSAGYQRNTNRLRSVDDAVGATNQKDDIEDQQEDNYRYDATGNLVYDRSEEIESIQWTVSGKVLRVIRATTSNKPNLEFTYDASGNRIAKKVIEKNGDYKTTFYVRDASGNVMAVYKTSGTTNLTLEEQHIYGSSRLGIFKKDKTRKSTTRALGERQYELTDHLGNVRVVLIDYYKVGMSMDDRVLSATDYYPFGMVARSRTTKNNYRYGFNGKEDDNETGWQDYGMRMYNPTLCRFFTVDPISKQYPMLTPYQFASNTPIDAIDLDGLEKYSIHLTNDNEGNVIDIKVVTYSNGSGELVDMELKDVNGKLVADGKTYLIVNKDLNGNVINYTGTNEPDVLIKRTIDEKYLTNTEEKRQGSITFNLINAKGRNYEKVVRKEYNATIIPLSQHILNGKSIEELDDDNFVNDQAKQAGGVADAYVINNIKDAAKVKAIENIEASKKVSDKSGSKTGRRSFLKVKYKSTSDDLESVTPIILKKKN